MSHLRLKLPWRRKPPLKDPYYDVKSGARSIDTDVCDRCFNIPWEKLVQSAGSGTTATELPEIAGFQPTCRICVLLQNVDLSAFENLWPETKSEDEDSTHHTNELSAMICLDFGNKGTLFSIVGLKDSGDIARAPGSRPGNIDISQTRRWIAKCQTDHQQCEKDIDSRWKLQNLRVIDCERRAVVFLPLECQFVALSYVWGPLTAYSAGEEYLETPPKTIAQSIQFTQELGHKYLWVDRYVNFASPLCFVHPLTVTMHRPRR